MPSAVNVPPPVQPSTVNVWPPLLVVRFTISMPESESVTTPKPTSSVSDREKSTSPDCISVSFPPPPATVPVRLLPPSVIVSSPDPNWRSTTTLLPLLITPWEAELDWTSIVSHTSSARFVTVANVAPVIPIVEAAPLFARLANVAPASEIVAPLPLFSKAPNVAPSRSSMAKSRSDVRLAVPRSALANCKSLVSTTISPLVVMLPPATNSRRSAERLIRDDDLLVISAAIASKPL